MDPSKKAAVLGAILAALLLLAILAGILVGTGGMFGGDGSARVDSAHRPALAATGR